MMTKLTINPLPAKTMSSSQLSALLGKEKKHIHESIKKVFGDNLDGRNIRPCLDGRGYVSEYILGELESKMFVAKHDIGYLEKITQYWIDRNNTAPALPQNYIEALEFLVESEKEKQIAVNETNRLQAVCQTMAKQFVAGSTIPQFVKELNGVNSQKINSFLHFKGWLHKDGSGEWQVSSYARDRMLKQSSVEYENKHKGSFIQVTEKGARNIYAMYLKGLLPMKKTWDGNHTHDLFARECV